MQWENDISTRVTTADFVAVLQGAEQQSASDVAPFCWVFSAELSAELLRCARRAPRLRFVPVLAQGLISAPHLSGHDLCPDKVARGSPCRVPVSGEKGVQRSCIPCAANASRAQLGGIVYNILFREGTCFNTSAKVCPYPAAVLPLSAALRSGWEVVLHLRTVRS